MHAIDIDPRKIEKTGAHLAEAGLSGHVTLHEGDAAAMLARIEPAVPFDFAFIDAVKGECFAYLDALKPKLASRCALATDNTGTHPDALASFVAHLRDQPGWTSCDVPVGNGFELTWRGR